MESYQRGEMSTDTAGRRTPRSMRPVMPRRLASIPFTRTDETKLQQRIANHGQQSELVLNEQPKLPLPDRDELKELSECDGYAADREQWGNKIARLAPAETAHLLCALTEAPVFLFGRKCSISNDSL